MLLVDFSAAQGAEFSEKSCNATVACLKSADQIRRGAIQMVRYFFLQNFFFWYSGFGRPFAVESGL
jgi:hypothetical protein